MTLRQLRRESRTSFYSFYWPIPDISTNQMRHKVIALYPESIDLSGFWKFLHRSAEVLSHGTTLNFVLPLSRCHAQSFDDWLNHRWVYGPTSPPTHLFLGGHYAPTEFSDGMWERLRLTLSSNDHSISSVTAIEEFDTHTKQSSIPMRTIIFLPSPDSMVGGENATRIYFKAAKKVIVETDVMASVSDEGGRGKPYSSFDYYHTSSPPASRPLYANAITLGVPRSKKMPAQLFALCGTSSAGKTTVARMLAQHGYRVIPRDDLYEGKMGIGNFFYGKMFVEVQDHLTEFGAMEKIERELLTDLVLHLAAGYPTAIIDTIGWSLPKWPRGKGIIIGIHAPISDMVRNFISRMSNEPRSVRIFFMYALAWHALPTKPSQSSGIKAVDTVTKNEIRKQFAHIKAFFNDENDLASFTKDFFQRLGMSVTNDSDANMSYYIVPNPSTNYCNCDYVVNTKDLSPYDVFKVVLAIIEKELAML
jgi:hypothetical protein